MKKLLLTILAVGSIAAANAQEGTILVYGNVGVTSNTDANKVNYLSWNITPGVGYQFDNHWTAGLSLNYSLDSSIKADGAADRLKASHYNIGAFLRYTKMLNNIFAVYGQLDLGYQAGHQELGSTEIPGSKYNGLYAMVTPAVAIFIPKWFALNFSFGGLGYTSYKVDQAPNSNGTFAFTFGKTMNIGISRNFGCGMGHKMHGHAQPGDDTRHMDTSDDDDDAPKAKKTKTKTKTKEKDGDE
ncbi:MAG: porin family protein [Taibaiella sp.]|nr:porin family protein [Taibaiella sp.]